MNDHIDRQAAIDVIENLKGMARNRKTVSKESAVYALKELPSAQPQLPEWAQKVEEYRQSAPQHIYNPLAWALYQVWKEYDG